MLKIENDELIKMVESKQKDVRKLRGHKLDGRGPADLTHLIEVLELEVLMEKLTNNGLNSLNEEELELLNNIKKEFDGEIK